MATHRQILVALQQQTQLACSGLTMFNAPLQVQAGVGWPPTHTLQALTKMSPPGAAISVFDRKSGRDSTRWIPSYVAQRIVPATVVSSPTSQILPPLGTCQIVLTGTPTLSDAVSLVATNFGAQASQDPGDGSYTSPAPPSGVVAAGASATSATLAAALAALPAATPPLGSLLTATSVGSVVTLTSLVTRALTVTTYTGNGGILTREIGRRHREVLLSVWAPTVEVRDTVAGAIEGMVAQMEMFLGSTGQFASGLPLADGSSARVLALNDYQIDDPVLSDLYRHDFLVSVDYPVTVMDNVYAVLVPAPQYQFTA